MNKPIILHYFREISIDFGIICGLECQEISTLITAHSCMQFENLKNILDEWN